MWDAEFAEACGKRRASYALSVKISHITQSLLAKWLLLCLGLLKGLGSIPATDIF